MIHPSETKQQIKDFALAHAKIDKIGVAGIERFNGAPEGYHPTDFLPGCKSAIVCAIRLPDGAVQAVYRMLEDRRLHLHGIYPAYGYTGAANYTLLFAAMRIARFVERLTGEACAPIPAGPTHGAKTMSLRHSAVAAGIAEFGWHGLAMTPEFGTRNRFCVILTTAELESDPLYDGPPLCDPVKCGVCAAMCPTNAIGKYDPKRARSFDVGGKPCEYSMFDGNRCKMATSGMFAEFNDSGRDLYDVFANPHPIHTEADGLQAFYYTHMNNNFFMHATSWKCGYCMMYCPAGNWKERFFDTGLSKIDTRKYIKD
ncbi:MAG: hypothetical protein LBS91_08410 [Clostridiales Family XIII bacterium]|jgi:epoxyqueuosine reductase QueG|nr:hypothetical protein [Clostridiales Family XIII bacterium]